MIPLLPLLPDVKFNKEKKPDKTGTCGKIYNVVDGVIGKMMSAKPGYVCIEVGFLEENLTHLLCLLQKIDKSFSHNVFPQIYEIYRTDETNSPTSIIVTMEKVPNDFKSIFKRKTLLEQIDQIIIIAAFLSDLQGIYGFVHGDMHHGNIMLSKDMKEITTDDTSIDRRVIVDNSIKLKVHLPYIIDFGRACINLKNVSQKHVTYKTEDYYHCENGSYDMRIFIASILHFMAKPLQSFFIERFKKYDIYEFKCPTYHHNFVRNHYNDAKEFYPDVDPDESFEILTLKKDLFEFRRHFMGEWKYSNPEWRYEGVGKDSVMKLNPTLESRQDYDELFTDLYTFGDLKRRF